MLLSSERRVLCICVQSGFRVSAFPPPLRGRHRMDSFHLGRAQESDGIRRNPTSMESEGIRKGHPRSKPIDYHSHHSSTTATSGTISIDIDRHRSISIDVHRHLPCCDWSRECRLRRLPCCDWSRECRLLYVVWYEGNESQHPLYQCRRYCISNTDQSNAFFDLVNRTVTNRTRL